MKLFKKAFTAILMPILFLFMSINSYGQRSDRAITDIEKKQIIDTALALLKANYIFPEKLTVMEERIYKKFSTGEYSKFTVMEDFIKHINADLENFTNDRHVNLFHDPVRVKQIVAEAKGDNNKPGYAPEFLQRAKFENYMIRKVERLDGNIGYLKFNIFVDTFLSKKTLVAAMGFIANSSALIIDLRQNGGGDSHTCSFLLGYFLPDSTLISQRRSRSNNSLSKGYINHVSSLQKFSQDVPVYILVSKRTSSAAEAFAYTLQASRRAVIIGDTTKGEANPGYLYALNKEMYIMIPAFESINPITKTNWQAKGVIPDIKISADKALIMAQSKLYEKLATTSSNEDLKNMYSWMAIGLLAEVQPINIKDSELKSFAGDYSDDRHISFSNGSLFYYKGDNEKNKKKLIPLGSDLFGVEAVPFFSLRFIKSEKGQITSLEGMYDDGKKEVSSKLAMPTPSGL